MSDVDVVLGALPRIDDALRAREVRVAFHGPGLTDHQVGILSHLDASDPTMVTELAEFLGVTASTMSLNLKRLEAGGYITRARDPADRRVMNVLLTPSGVEVREAARRLDPLKVDGVLRELSPSQRAEVIRGLTLLVEAADRFVRRGRAHVDALAAEEAEW